jgi:WD40 repeat protein
LGLIALAFAPALAEDQGAKDATDLYDRPVLAIDPGMHTASIQSQAVDAEGRFAVTGGKDRAVRIWSVADGGLLRTIWIPAGPEHVGVIYAVAISPDGSTIAAGGWTESLQGDTPIYIFDRESGELVRRIGGDLPEVTYFLTFSPDGRYLAAMLGGERGLRVFDRDKDWSEAFRDEPLRRRQLWRGVRARRPSRDDVLGRTDSPLQVRPQQRQPELSRRRSARSRAEHSS